MPGIHTVYNDNKACVDWSKRSTTKGLRHIQMHENCVFEQIERQFVNISHIDGKWTLVDIFAKKNEGYSLCYVTRS
jgi:hypothetical protein